MITKKNHVGKPCSNPQCFKEKITKLNSNQLNIKKIKSTKIILKKIITKKKTQKKHMMKHCSNPQCCVRKAIVLSLHDLVLLILFVIVILNQLNIKKNQERQFHKKTKKDIWGKHYSNPQ
jgi:hypothetical protein